MANFHVGRKNIHPAAIREARLVMCKVPGCSVSNQHGYVRGLCSAHYQRWLKGKPLNETPVKVTRRYTEFPFAKGGEDDCWEWQGRKSPTGYGRLEISGRSVMAHRYVYESFGGEIPDGYVLDHSCLNRLCVNPAHLEPVTSSENSRRAMETYISRKVCATVNCEAFAVCREYCRNCYSRLLISEFGKVVSKLPFEDRLKRYSIPRSDGCVDWVGSLDHYGYGSIMRFGKPVGAHKAAYEFHIGEYLPKGILLDHLCQNKMCVRVDHLEPVSRAENTRRAWSARKSQLEEGDEVA